MPNPFRPVGLALKAGTVRLSRMLFTNTGRWGWGQWWNRPRNESPFAAEVGDGSGNAIVVATLNWIGKNFSEAKPRVSRPSSKGDLTPIPNHPMVKLLRRPNPAYSGMTLWLATLADWKLGNAYWYKIRNSMGGVVQLWWIPSSFMTPRWDTTDPSSYIDWYDYNISGVPERLDPRDVVHFKNGLDPQNTRQGRSALYSVLTEVYNDDEAARYVAALLHNLGVPGVIISPNGDGTISPQDGVILRDTYQQHTTGSHRGEPLVIPSSVNVHTPAFSPQQMDVKAWRRIPEERITAVLGVPALVAGMGVGLDHATLANADTLNRMATENELTADWRYFSEEIQFQLLPEFDDTGTIEFDFDLSDIKSLQEDRTTVVDRAVKLWTVGVYTLNETLSEIGEEPIGQEGEVRAVPINLMITQPADFGIPAPAPPTATQSGVLPTDAQPAKMLELKSEQGWISAVERLRAHLEPVGTSEMSRFLRDQQARVIASLTESKAALPDGMDWAQEDARLTKALHPTYMRALTGTTDLMRQYTEADVTVDDALVRSYLRAAGQQIKGINGTTRRLIQEALAEGQALDEDIGQLARRIQQLTGFNASRAEMIAVTELGSSTALATTHAAQLAGVKAMQIHDPDGSDHGFTGCTDRHGKVVTTIEAFGVGLLHPRCRVVLVPVTRAPVTQRSNGHAALVTA